MMNEKVILKECPQHGLTEHVLRSDGRYRCRKCAADYIQHKRYKIKEKAVEYKGGKCEICGYDKCIDALEFHHLDPSQKDFGISKEGYSNKWENIQKELDKCIMVCANCHREIHSRDHKKIKDIIINKRNDITNYNDYIEKIIHMRDIENKSYYEIANELKISRNTVMKYYKKYKNNS